MTLALLGGGWLWLRDSPLVAVEQVQINGVQGVYAGQVDAALVLRDAERIGREGACVIFYPEATVTRDPDKWPMVAKTGVARLALSAGLPVIPVALGGAAMVTCAYWAAGGAVLAAFALTVVAVLIWRLFGGTDGYVGDVTAASAGPGHGATFTLTLPLQAG